MKRILLIEDNDDIRNNAAEILELSNYEVILAENGKIGVEKALAFKPDLIICDIMMPVLDGYGVLHAIQKNEGIKNTPFIFLTAKTERGDFRKGMELGADDYISKPFDGTDLLNAVDSRLKKIALLKQNFESNKQEISLLFQSGSGKNALSLLTAESNSNRYKKKQTIYSEGNHPNRIYQVLSGKVKAFKTNEEGKELVTELYSTGDFFGYIALIEATVYKDTTEAIEETELAIIAVEHFNELLYNDAATAQKFIQLLAKNITEKENKLLGLAYNSLRKKVAESLLLLQKKFMQRNDTNFVISISRESIASIAGTATESLIRTLSDFRAEKLIDIQDGSIVILNPKKLEFLAH